MVEVTPTTDVRHSNLPRTVLAISTIVLSWLLMQVIHESGHVLGALLTGGTVRRVVLVPWELSRTDLLENPQPLIVCWAGPIFGAVCPFVVGLMARQMKSAASFWLRFFAGFCLIANGAYLGAGAFTHDGDAGDLLHHGSPIWTLWLFAAMTVPIGFIIWHRLGSHFGLGRDAPVIRWPTALASAVALTVIIMAEVIFAKV